MRTKPRDLFSVICLAAGVSILITLLAIVIFLGWRAIPVLTDPTLALPGGSVGFWDYVIPLIFGSVWAAFLALLFATPVSVGVALFTTIYLPYKLSKRIGNLVDILAAIPSVIYGLWGVQVLAPLLAPVYGWLGKWLPWLPFFSGSISETGRTILTASLVLAIMILPVMTALCREIFLQIPKFLLEGAMALGANRREMIKLVVMPISKAGIFSAAILGLGRALGETVAIALVLSASGVITFSLISTQNPNTIASNIVLEFPEAQGPVLAALIGSGLVLFSISFVINLLAQNVVRRQTKILRGI